MYGLASSRVENKMSGEERRKQDVHGVNSCLTPADPAFREIELSTKLVCHDIRLPYIRRRRMHTDACADTTRTLIIGQQNYNLPVAFPQECLKLLEYAGIYLTVQYRMWPVTLLDLITTIVFLTR